VGVIERLREITATRMSEVDDADLAVAEPLEVRRYQRNR
jgi:hypothetical protein